MNIMADSLKRALRSRQLEIEAGLVEARNELATLEARAEELRALIVKAERALGQDSLIPEGEGRMTLHAALELVLKENDNRWMHVGELADAVNTRGLYRKRDGSTVEPNQVHARTKNYSSIFEKNGPQIRLHDLKGTHDVVVFCDDDAGFFDWLDRHANGLFINAERKPRPTYLVLHLVGCAHFDRSPSLQWTKDYIKICSDHRSELEEWASDVVGGEVTLCRSCFG